MAFFETLTALQPGNCSLSPQSLVRLFLSVVSPAVIPWGAMLLVHYRGFACLYSLYR